MFFKKKKIVLEAYAPVGDLIDLFPIVESSKSIPTWYNKLPTSRDDNPNVRNCFGLKDLYKKGIIIPLWADYEISVDPVRGISATSGMQNQATFPPLVSNDTDAQTGGAWPNYVNLKFNSPWLFWWPGSLIVSIALCVNFIGDGLRDAFDPRQRRHLSFKDRMKAKELSGKNR
jgi:hypothetical protein